MDWKATKTIFICVFLLLNIFLFKSFLDTTKSDHLATIQAETIEEKLANYQITFPELSESVDYSKKITGKPRAFTVEDFANVEGGTTFFMFDQTQAEVVLGKPYQLSSDYADQLKKFLMDYVPNGEQYQLFTYDQDRMVYTFFQQHDGKMLYRNRAAQLSVYVDSEHRIISYVQTMITDIETIGSKQREMSALKAIENLYDKGSIPSDSKLTKVELGYFSLFVGASYQVLEPTWHVVVNNTDHYYVTAFEGRIFVDE